MRRRRAGGRVPRRWPRAATGLVAAAALALPAVGLATSVNRRIPDGHYATVMHAHVPGGEDVEFTLRGHAYLIGLNLACNPDPTDADLIANSGSTQIRIWAHPKQITMKNGSFSYSGAAKVTAAYRGAPQVATATLRIEGHYIRNGHVYRYTSPTDNPVIATLTFKGSATSTGCSGQPANHTFRLYYTQSVTDGY
jgi:hypothetical protein